MSVMPSLLREKFTRLWRAMKNGEECEACR